MFRSMAIIMELYLSLAKVTVVKNVRQNTSLLTMQWCGRILCQVYRGVYNVCSAG
jgi:hypothetical protein